jgi:hypothetical protein
MINNGRLLTWSRRGAWENQLSQRRQPVVVCLCEKPVFITIPSSIFDFSYFIVVAAACQQEEMPCNTELMHGATAMSDARQSTLMGFHPPQLEADAAQITPVNASAARFWWTRGKGKLH